MKTDTTYSHVSHLDNIRMELTNLTNPYNKDGLIEVDKIDELIKTAVNACKEINPDNPLNAAKYITAMFNRLKEISEKTDKWDTTKNILDHITK